jgi:cyanophycinase
LKSSGRKEFAVTHVRPHRTLIALALICIALIPAGAAQADEWQGGPGYRTFAIGDELAPTPAPAVGGLLLNGGGDWPIEAFRWFTAHAGHGHLVVLRASGSTEIQDEFYNEVKGVLSVRTFVFTDRKAASDPRLLAAVKAADALFIGGGDQSNYVRMWRGTPLNEALDAHLAAGKPLGGTSAGLAIQGAWLYGCMDSISITSRQAMADPLGKAVTIEGHFLHDPLLAQLLTDSHFDTRNRLGRLFAFLYSAHAHGAASGLAGLGIDEDAALTVEPDGTAHFHARDLNKHAWLVQPAGMGAIEPDRPLNLAGVRVTAIGTGSTFNVRTLSVGAPAFIRRYDVVNGAVTRQSEWTPASTPRAADTLFEHGYVYAADGADTVAQALAVRAGRIVYLGDDAGVQAYAGPRTRRIELAGRMLMPGLIDGHMHPQSGGLHMRNCSLGYRRLTVNEFQSIIQGCADRDTQAGPNDWLLVVDWFEQNMEPAGIVLTHAALDALATKRPIAVESSFDHSELVNARGLQLAAITRDTPDPKDGRIVRDAAGESTGLLEETAQELVDALLPTPTPAEQAQATRAALAAMRAQGITSFLDADTDIDTMSSFAQVQRAGELTARAHFAVLIDSTKDYDADRAIKNVLAQQRRFDQGPLQATPTLSVDTAKLYVDGVWSAPSYTSRLLQPYFEVDENPEHPDWEPGDNYGPPLYFSQDQLDATLVKLAAAGINPHMHADGDGAVHAGLDAVAALRRVHPADDIRPALAHSEIIDPADFPRFATLNALPVLSFQWEKPAADTHPEATRYLGPLRSALLEPTGLLKAYGARLVFGSDWPVDPLDEWLAMQVAVTRAATGDDRQRFSGRLGIDPGISVADAVRAMTINAAYSLRQDATTGSLETGKFADLIVLDQNLLQIAPQQIEHTKVLLTMVGGEIVYQPAAL